MQKMMTILMLDLKKKNLCTKLAGCIQARPVLEPNLGLAFVKGTWSLRGNFYGTDLPYEAYLLVAFTLGKELLEVGIELASGIGLPPVSWVPANSSLDRTNRFRPLSLCLESK